MNGLEGLGIRDAWAVVRPWRGKERFLAGRLLEQGADVYEPTLLMPRGCGALVPTPMYGGYMFVRPAIGRRERLAGQLYVGNVMPSVVAARAVWAIWAYCVEHDVVKRAEKANTAKASEPVVLRSLAELGMTRIAEAVDSRNLEALFVGLRRDSRRFVGRIEDYYRTDELADVATISAIAIPRQSLSFS